MHRYYIDNRNLINLEIVPHYWKDSITKEYIVKEEWIYKTAKFKYIN